MIKCNKCGNVYEDGSKFCGTCGLPLTGNCCYYHSGITASSFCSHCGKLLCASCALPGSRIALKFKNHIFCNDCYQETARLMERYRGAQKEVAKSAFDVFKAVGGAILKL